MSLRELEKPGLPPRKAVWPCAVATALSLTALLTGSAPAALPSPAKVTCDERRIGFGPHASRHIAGTYCRPADGSATIAIVMIPGGSYNRVYWDFPYEPGTYSFARAAARNGYAAIAIDRLGTGKSSRPLSLTVTSTVQARALHNVVTHLRRDGLDGAAFERVLLAGHSAGSSVSLLEAATYQDVDGVVITGLLHKPNPDGVATVFLTFYPAILDPAFNNLGLDLGYFTTRPGTRQHAFHDPGEVDPEVIATDEATKDAFSVTELPDGFGATLLGYSSRVRAPVLLAVGSADTAFCGPPLATDCSSPSSILEDERPEYATAPCVDAIVMPGAGHDINLHPSAPSLQDQVLAWTDAVAAGECPQGP